MLKAIFFGVVAWLGVSFLVPMVVHVQDHFISAGLIAGLVTFLYFLLRGK